MNTLKSVAFLYSNKDQRHSSKNPIYLHIKKNKFPKINKFPTILLFNPDNKDNPIEYNGNLYSWEFIYFRKSNFI